MIVDQSEPGRRDAEHRAHHVGAPSIGGPPKFGQEVGQTGVGNFGKLHGEGAVTRHRCGSRFRTGPPHQPRLPAASRCVAPDSLPSTVAGSGHVTTVAPMVATACAPTAGTPVGVTTGDVDGTEGVGATELLSAGCDCAAADTAGIDEPDGGGELLAALLSRPDSRLVSRPSAPTLPWALTSWRNSPPLRSERSSRRHGWSA